MKLIVSICFCLLLPIVLLCQTTDPVLDSLKQPLPKTANLRQKAERLQAILRRIFFSNEYAFGNFPEQLDSLNKCCIAGNTGDRRFEKTVEADVAFYKGAALLYEQPSIAKSLFQPAFSQYVELGDSVKQAMFYLGNCIAASAEGDSLSFAEAHEQALRFAPAIRNPYELANLYGTLGISCYDFGRYAECIQYSFDILRLIDKNPTPEMLAGKASIYYNIGAVYQRLGDYANTKLYNEKAVKEATINKQDPADFLTGLAWVYILEKDYQKALEVYKSILSNNPVPSSFNQIAASTYVMAICYRNLGDLKLALTYARKGVELLPVQKHASYGSAALQELANCEFDLGMTDSALVHALLAFQTFSKANNNGGSVESAELLTKIYKQKNDYRKALAYSELRYKYKQQVERQQSIRQLAFGEFTRDNEVKTARREAEVKAQLDQQRNIRYALFAGLAVLALLAFLLYNRYRFKQRSTAQLEAKNREVEAARERAEKSEAFKSRFLANMSHEIRTPLHGIAGFTDLVLETSLSEKQRRYLSSIQHSTERLTEVVNDILDISKLEAGEVRLRQVPFSPARIAHDVREALSVRAENKGIELTVHIGEGVPDAVLGDPTRLYQILMNLAGNAVKFTSVGSVQLAVTSPQSAVGSVRSLDGSRSHALTPLTFSLYDTGIGIPLEKLATIFDSFQQADEDTTARFGGTGLGLTIARELLHLHGSDIQVESKVGKGSIFSFTLALPLADAADLEQSNGIGNDLYFTQPLKILLADDNAFNREIATEALLRHFENIEISEAENGREALRMLEISEKKGSRFFDLILMDMQMPEMNGVEATRHIRQQLGFDIPIIALTASATPQEIEAAMAAGMNRHLAKPFKPHELARAIAEVLALKSSTSTTRTDSHSPQQPIIHNSPLLTPYDFRYVRDFCDGDEVQVRHFVQKFRAQYPLEIERLEAALLKEDRESIYLAAHGLKPQLEFMGLKEAAGKAAEIEQGARNNLSFLELKNIRDQLNLLLGQLS